MPQKYTPEVALWQDKSLNESSLLFSQQDHLLNQLFLLPVQDRWQNTCPVLSVLIPLLTPFKTLIPRSSTPLERDFLLKLALCRLADQEQLRKRKKVCKKLSIQAFHYSNPFFFSKLHHLRRKKKTNQSKIQIARHHHHHHHLDLSWGSLHSSVFFSTAQ